MPSYKPKVQILLNEEYHKKFKALCEKERRSDSVMGAIMIEKFINEYEKENGIIEIKEKPTKAEAMEEIKTTIEQHKEKGFLETAKKSFKAGFDFGNADK